jgi:hypothetical protein
MQAGTCVGAVPANGCQYQGWSPMWLPPLSFADTVDSVAAGDTLCPFCWVDRARSSGVPGFSNQKANRIRAALAGLWCMSAGGSRSTSHVHKFDFVNEDLFTARGHDEPIQPGERGY